MKFHSLSKKIFDADVNIRGLTIGKLDGGILHFQMREGIESLNPPGEIGKLDAEVFVPTLTEYFDRHKKYFGEVEYMLTKFEKVSIAYIKCENIYLVVSVEPGISVYPIVKEVQEVLCNWMRENRNELDDQTNTNTAATTTTAGRP